MSAIEIVAVVLAFAFGVLAVAAWILVVRLTPAIQKVNELSRDAQQILRRVEAVVERLDGAAEGVHNMERRVNGVVSTVMNQVEPEVRSLAALFAGVRTTFSTLVRGWNTDNGRASRSDTERSLLP